MQDEGDWLVNSGGYRNMIGRHEVATITDTYMKGFRDFDIEKAYEAMKRNSKEATMLSRHIGKDWRLNELDKVYLEKDFIQLNQVISRSGSKRLVLDANL